jgi:flagellar protein FlaF
MSNPANAYARTAQVTGSPRQIEAQALLKAAKQLQDVQSNWIGPDGNMFAALRFNSRLWSILLSAVEKDDNPQPIQIRQNIANLAGFILKRTAELLQNPDPSKLDSLISINRNIAAGLSGRP